MNDALLQSIPAEAMRDLTQALKKEPVTALSGIPESLAPVLAAWIAKTLSRRVLLIYTNDLKAARGMDDARVFLDHAAAHLPAAEIDLTRGTTSQDGTWRRLETLSRLSRNEIQLLTVSMDALIQRMGSPSSFHEGMLTLRPGQRLAPQDLMDALIHDGYERVNLVEGKGQCAQRGAILDIYPPDMSQAIRVEYFDDEIDSIRLFDPLSQRSLEKLEQAEIIPSCEILLPPSERSKAAARLRNSLGQFSPARREDILEDLPPIPDDDDALPDFFDTEITPRVNSASFSVQREQEQQRRMKAMLQDADLIEQGMPVRRLYAMLPLLTDHVTVLSDWFRPDLVVYCNPDQLRERCKERNTGFSVDLEAAIDRGDALAGQEKLLLSWEDATRPLLPIPSLLLSDLTKGLAGFVPTAVLHRDFLPLSGYASHLKQLAQDCIRWHDSGYTVILLCGGTARGQRLQQNLSELNVPCQFSEDTEHLPQGVVSILPLSLTRGFLFDEGKLVLVSDTDIFGASYHKARSRRKSGEKLAAFTDLNPGDYVVHEDHGVGLYQGTIQMKADGAIHEYLLIQYAGSDKLYVPIEQFQRVQRYIGNPSLPPKLNAIGGGEWSKAKGKVKEGLKKLAFDLVKLYAKRQEATGYAFSADTPWQQQFDDQFPFELTPDQSQSVDEIKHDMESPRNMDRLLCGDVGYGKTEVSLRAVFKCVMDGKQAAILAPTTILAQQHFNTIIKRFAGFPVHVEVLSRFRSRKEQTEILEKVASGAIDILVGTHRILGKDVKFKDLGLLVVDEEQRFGVGHKETIKNMKSQVDVLTLSATPIPRTLHMSMVGIRDMSILETPPENRLPVQTHVVEYSDILIRDVILRELTRGGQVYFLYNRVQSIERYYERLKTLVPEARIAVAHGQMKEHALEDIMMDFYAGSYDVLLCTTIIESGLDVPTANTLIVFDADRFGLSQLYQLRGRVGRSTRQAYAYFTYRANKMLSETAQQRLHAIREFTEFGSGFRVAMRDLEIRGAGNILGPEQHGHLAAVGYEMYCKLIEEAMNEAQGHISTDELETRVNLRVNAYLPENYITDAHQRMEMYKRITALTTDADRVDIVDELIDRFGEMPPVVETLLDVAQLRSVCNKLGISRIMRAGDALSMRLEDKYVPDPQALLLALRSTDPRLSVTAKQPTSILLTVPRTTDGNLMREGVKVMSRVLEKMPRPQKPAADTADAVDAYSDLA